jgi:oligopeptide transport system permease protein
LNTQNLKKLKAPNLTWDPDDFKKANPEEQENFSTKLPPVNNFRDAMFRLKKNIIAMTSAVIIILIMFFAFFGQIFIPYQNTYQMKNCENLYPMEYSKIEKERIANGEKVFPHILGTDRLGRDLAVRIIYATRISFICGILAAAIIIVVGTIYGSISGYFGGKVDFIMMRVVDALQTLPDILIVLLLSAVIKDPLRAFCNTHRNPMMDKILDLGPGVISMFLSIALLYWTGTASLIRGQVLMLKSQDYILASKALGAKPTWIIKKHILPNCISQIIVNAMMKIPTAIFLESALSFLGIGVSAPLASLGTLASDSLGGLNIYPVRLIVPSIILSLIILCFNLFGDGLRDALDPDIKG